MSSNAYETARTMPIRDVRISILDVRISILATGDELSVHV